MTPNGPRKIILLSSGRYDYAELEMAESLQIVGPNNLGKTTLINTLQLLYIDDPRQMQFGFTPEETQGFYFPDEYSYVLFECQTGPGRCVFGLRGTSPLTGGEPQRFFCREPFDSNDFISATGEVLPPEKVSAGLALKGYTPIARGSEHRDWLNGGVAGSKVHELGIISLRKDVRYEQFRATFKSLLFLSTITQDEMKEQLIVLASIPPRAATIDCRKLFGEAYQQIQLEKERIVKLREHGQELETLVENWEAREYMRAELIVRHDDLREKRERYLREHDETMERWHKQLTENTGAETRLRETLGLQRGNWDELNQKRGGAQRELDLLDAEAKEFSEYAAVEQFERGGIAKIEHEIGECDRQLGIAEAEDLESVIRRLDEVRRDIEAHEQKAAGFEKLLVTELRTTFSDLELERLLSIFSADLLGERVGPDGIGIHERAGLNALLSAALDRISDMAYRDDNITIPLRPAAEVLRRLESPEALREQVSRLRREVDRLAKAEQVLRDREAVTKQREKLREERDEKAKKLHRFEDFCRRRQTRSVLEESLATIATAMEKLRVEIASTETSIEESRKSQGIARRKMETERQAHAHVLEEWEKCSVPAFTARKVTEPVELGDTLEHAVAFFLRKQSKEAELHGKVVEGMRVVETHFADHFHRENESATIANLADQIEALPEKERALTQLWNAQITSLRKRFSELLKDLDEVKDAKTRLNRDFAEIEVSNLRSVRLEVVEQADELSWIAEIVKMEELPLWTEHDRLRRTLSKLTTRLNNNPVITFSSLFVLRFAVIGADGTTKHYSDFKVVESHGTTITLKVLFNLMILRSLLRRNECVLPFFLDEIQNLDETNRRGVFTLAKKLGFFALTASPEPVAEVSALYWLQSQDGHLTLDADSRWDLQHDEEMP